jgi:hypothetical protein
MCLPTNITIKKGKSAVAYSSNTNNNANKPIRERRLTFAPEISKVVGTVLSRKDYTKKEKKNCYWSRSERSVLRTNAMQQIHAIRDRGLHFVELIDDSLKVAQYLSTSLEDKKGDSLLKDPSKYTSKLEAWTLIGQAWRGLERYISVFQKGRFTTRREIIAMVVDTQHMGVSSEEAAEIYAKQCLSSRVYARWMGDADYSSAYCDEDYCFPCGACP